MTSQRITMPQGNAIPWKVVAVVILAPFMTQMDATIVNVSMSSIRESLHAPIASAQWIISGYLLALALALPLNGWLVDRLGAKKVYLFCFTGFTFASWLCGLARTMPELILARVIQGAAGGLLSPLTQLMMARIAGQQMARVIGYASVPVLIAPLFGPLLAGVILKHASWPWLFYVNLPIGLVAIVSAVYLIPHDPSLIQKRPFDFFGFALLSPGLSCSLYGIERLSHHGEYGILLLGIFLAGAFIATSAKKKEDALVDLRLFKIRTFSVATTTQFLANGVIYAGQFLVPLYLVSYVGLSPEKAGWILAAMGFGMLCIYPAMGNLTDRFGCRAVASTGVVVNFLGTLPFVWMSTHVFSLPVAVVCLVLRGLGQGATGIPSISAAYASVPREKLSFATTAVNIVQRLGGPVMTTAVSIVTSKYVGAHVSPGEGTFQTPFVVLIVLQLAVLASALRLPVKIQPPPQNDAPPPEGKAGSASSVVR